MRSLYLALLIASAPSTLGCGDDSDQLVPATIEDYEEDARNVLPEAPAAGVPQTIGVFSFGGANNTLGETHVALEGGALDIKPTDWKHAIEDGEMIPAILLELDHSIE